MYFFDYDREISHSILHDNGRSLVFAQIHFPGFGGKGYLRSIDYLTADFTKILINFGFAVIKAEIQRPQPNCLKPRVISSIKLQMSNPMILTQ